MLETHLAYNRVALTDYFQHRSVEKLYLNQGDLQLLAIDYFPIVYVQQLSGTLNKILSDFFSTPENRLPP